MDLRKTSINALRCICMPDEPIIQILKRWKKIQPDDGDLIEIGIETMEKSEWETTLNHLREKITSPLLLAARGKILTAERLKIYEAAIDDGLDWIDVDFRSNKIYIKKLIQKLKKNLKRTNSASSKTRLILSVHLSTTPPPKTMQKWIEDMRTLGKSVATLPKVATTITRSWDPFRLLQLIRIYEKKKIGIVLHGSGDQSAESRLLQATSGSAITYLCFSKELATAKGQWTIADWNRTIGQQA